MGKSWNLPLDHGGVDLGIISYWGKLSMLFSDVEPVDCVKKLVPSVFSVRLESHDGVEEFPAHFMGESVLHSFLKPCFSFTEGELNSFGSALIRRDMTNNIPISVVKGRPEILNNVSTDQGYLICEGFVAFSEGGGVAGLVVFLMDIDERSIFLQKCAKLLDAFLSPIDF